MSLCNSCTVNVTLVTYIAIGCYVSQVVYTEWRHLHCVSSRDMWCTTLLIPSPVQSSVHQRYTTTSCVGDMSSCVPITCVIGVCYQNHSLLIDGPYVACTSHVHKQADTFITHVFMSMYMSILIHGTYGTPYTHTPGYLCTLNMVCVT